MPRPLVSVLGFIVIATGLVAPLKAVEFAPHDLWSIGLGPGYLMTADADSSKIAYEAHSSVPAYWLLGVLGKVPGLTFELGLGYDYGLFFQVAPAIRMQLFGPVHARLGGGIGYNFEESMYAPVVGGLDIYAGDVVCLNLTYTRLLAAAASIEDSGRLTLAISISGRYEN